MLIRKRLYLTTVSGQFQEEAKLTANKEGGENNTEHSIWSSIITCKSHYCFRPQLLTCYQQDVFWFGSSSGKLSRRLENCHIKRYLYYITAFWFQRNSSFNVCYVIINTATVRVPDYFSNRLSNFNAHPMKAW